MRQRFDDVVERGRVTFGHFMSPPFATWGVFKLITPKGLNIVVVASDGADKSVSQGWQHVSVSAQQRIPNWEEMCWVKNLFWYKEECAIQFHPPESVYVNYAKNCLHLWWHPELIRPPTVLVGPRNSDEAAEQLKTLLQ